MRGLFKTTHNDHSELTQIIVHAVTIARKKEFFVCVLSREKTRAKRARCPHFADDHKKEIRRSELLVQKKTTVERIKEASSEADN